MTSGRRRAAAAAGGLAVACGYALVYRLGRTYGSTPSERARVLPGDGIVASPQIEVTHATTIDAAPADTWPWLAQMGWHRGGWYTARWVDRLLFPVNWPSATRIVPELQGLRIGDVIPDGPPESGCGFVVEDLRAPYHLVLHSTTHLPRSWRERGLRVDWSWAFVLEPTVDGRRTRFLFRWRARAAPWWLLVGVRLTIVPADFVMSRDMLRGITTRAEGLARSGLADVAPYGGP